MIADIAKEKDLWIIADEVYREFVYEGLEYTSFGNIKEVEDRVVIIDSVSKRYSACGARIGSIACKNKQFMAEVMKELNEVINKKGKLSTIPAVFSFFVLPLK